MSRARSVLFGLPSALGRAGPRLRSLPRREWVLLVQAPIALPVMAIALRRKGLTAVQDRLLGGRACVQAPPSAQERRELADRLAWCVQVAAAYGPWPANCLQRSVVLCWFLHRRGLTGDLRMGVRRGDDGALDFHAWVEHDGVVLAERRDVRQRYATFTATNHPERI